MKSSQNTDPLKEHFASYEPPGSSEQNFNTSISQMDKILISLQQQNNNCM